MTAPAVVIRLELEARPLVYADALTDTDAARAWLWVNRDTRRRELVARALELAREERAA
jgi:hypothetical protein